MCERYHVWVLVGLVGLHGGCGEPIVPRGPEQLYGLAREQIRNQNYVRALDTLARIARESPDSPYAVKATLTRLVLLAGLARSSLALGQVYLQAGGKAQEPDYRSELRIAAMGQFGVGQSWALGLVEGLDPWPRVLAAKPWVIDPVLPLTPAAEHPALGRLREGQRVASPERAAIERNAIRRGLAEMMAALAGAPGDFGRAYERLARENAPVEPAVVYLAFGNELVSLSALFGKEALDNPRYLRLFHERALALAERGLAASSPSDPLRARQADELRQRCREVLSARPATPRAGLPFDPGCV